MAASANISVSATACSAATIPYPSLYGAEFLSMEATYVANHSQFVHTGYYTNHGSVNVTNIDFCNVTLSYTHPGYNDTVNVQVWLPTNSWNGRLQAIGGGGWQSGLYVPSLMGMTGAIGEGYSTISTDAGLGSSVYPSDWALVSPGNVNLYLLQNLGSVSLNDMSIIGKQISTSFYGQAPEYSYFSGCSQGGRQGLMLAQRYPDAFDGIAASAPAINWNKFTFSDFWPGFLMRTLGEFPPACEFDAITNAVLDACDGLDGLVDGVIANPDACDFDPMSLVGQTINCTTFDNATNWPISTAAAFVMKKTWEGPKKTDNSSIWFGFTKDSSLTTSSLQQGVLSTICDSNQTCTPQSFELVDDWIKLFFYKNASADLSTMTHEELDLLAEVYAPIYESIIGTSNPDLSAFHKRGGKLLGYHGISDSIIPVMGSQNYYDSVASVNSNVDDFYRLFLAPGLGHCFSGNGAYPDGTFDAMRKWVEEGVAPETLNATSVGTTTIIQRTLCPYPKRQYYDGVGNATIGEGFYCE